MNWYIGVLKNYVGFSGRARRQEYWMFILISGIIGAIINLIQMLVGMQIPWLTIIYTIATLLPNLAVTARRLHDTERSGWWMLICLVPFGVIAMIVFLCKAGTSGTNRFGNDPKYSVNN
ncbi:DUF805 domain-containing protein [Superficieibacter sp. HKU1]|uniref:DUF805 domain-containing protein n=1 Tax=Superficieibacter sp. HKU1 TaxID=3031919 RepID=UPI0023E2C2DA|nr:DUF805 domain-containing protein [Superficieibacter sp. HKU1]WES67793.1 DUF805 domain-containing protein [Superficieibacter sp. HKU1]